MTAAQSRKRAVRRGQEPLSRERVLRAALTLADRDGIERFSMRRLASELGVEAMSLYHYYPSKDEILAAMLDAVYREIDVRALDGDWRDSIRAMAISFHGALLDHPWACGLLMSSIDLREPRMRHMDAVLSTLTEAGLSESLVDHAYHALDSYIVGFTLWQLPIRAIADELPDLAQQFVRHVPRDQYPHLVAHIEYHMTPRSNEENAFEFGLRLLLDGLERLRASSSDSRSL